MSDTAAERYERVRHAILVRLKVDIDHEWTALQALFKREFEAREKAEARIAELNAFIVKLTRETPYPDEVRQLDGQVRRLIAEVGTLRAELAEMRR